MTSVYGVALRWRSRRETGGGLIHPLRLFSDLEKLNVFCLGFLAKVWGGSLSRNCLSSLLYLNVFLGDLCSKKEEVAVESHPVAALGCPRWTSLLHWLASQAAGSGLQNRFRKGFLTSFSCDVTSPFFGWSYCFSTLVRTVRYKYASLTHGTS